MKYIHTSLPGRAIGPVRFSSWGLGNLLFPWARALVFADQYGLQMVWPKWAQFHPGSWIRWELDKRTYHSLFQRTEDYVQSIPTGVRQFSETELDAFLAFEGDACLLVDQFMKGNFDPLLGSQGLIWEELIRISRFDLLALQRASAGTIAVHVRLGDMTRVKGGVTSVEWYARRIQEIREVDPDRPILVYSDDQGAALEPLWELPHVTRAPQAKAAICDIAAMSGADLLIAGKGSTFSRWACFLSGMPVVSHSHDEWWRDAWKPFSRCAIGLVGEEQLDAQLLKTLSTLVRSDSSDHSE